MQNVCNMKNMHLHKYPQSNYNFTSKYELVDTSSLNFWHVCEFQLQRGHLTSKIILSYRLSSKVIFIGSRQSQKYLRWLFPIRKSPKKLLFNWILHPSEVTCRCRISRCSALNNVRNCSTANRKSNLFASIYVLCIGVPACLR